jgi:hypothetical protein
MYVYMYVQFVSCGQTVLGMNIRFGAKDAPFIRTSGTENPIRKFHHPYFGGEMGRGMENVGKNTLKFDYLGLYERY